MTPASDMLTLLIADVQGSVPQHEADVEAAAKIRSRLRRHFSEAAARRGGIPPAEAGESDSFLSGFTRASDAVACALDVQRAAMKEPWFDGRPLPIRMALHSGEIQVGKDGRYAGRALDRCTRLLALARSGQVVCSRATHDLVVDGLPESASLRDLGEHRLRDLARAERVFQLCHPDLPDDLAGFRSLFTFPNNLPQPLTSFVGRERELVELRELLFRSRVLTLTGTGGCGKSRLAQQVATAELAGFPDGSWWVELAPIGDPQLVPPVIAQVFGVRPLLGQTELEAVVTYLAPRKALVVLDNCEHLLLEAARVAEALARGCPSLRVVATSREPLRAEGETEWRVPSLSVPDHPGEGKTADSFDAVRLFVERAALVRPGFELTKENTPAVVAICSELDGIPLAIELAAAGLRAFSVEQVAAGLADRFRLLAGGARTALPRQQALRASVDWSYELLSEPERIVFRRLGVFAAGFTLDAAECVCSGESIEPDGAPGLLAALVEKSLVQAEERGPAVRYRLLETMRRYALERLADADETDRAQDRHRDYYLELAERTEPGLLTPRQSELLDVLDPEAANLALAIERAAATEPDKALRAVVALTLWWRLRSLFAQGEAGFVRALDAATEPSVLRARALWGRAYLLVFGGALETGFPAAQEALETAEEIGDASTMARTLWLIGVVTMWADPLGSRPVLERARLLAAESDDEFGLMHATQGLGMSYVLQDDHHGATPFHEEALQLAERLGQQDALAWHWLAKALGAYIAGDQAAVQDTAQRALRSARRVGDVVTESGAAVALGLAHIDAGQPQQALEKLVAVRDRALARGGAFILGAVDWTIATAYAADGRLEEARSAMEALIEQGAAGWAYVLARGHAFLGEVGRLLGDTEGARRAAEEGLQVADRIGDRPIAAETSLVLGRLAAARGDWAEAQRMIHETLVVAWETGYPRVPRVLQALAEVANGVESHTEAARILGSVRRLWNELGMVPWLHQRMETEAFEGRVRQALGAEAFERALAEGLALTAADAVAYVQRARGERKRPSAGWESLTPTELEVARHAASGLTNPQIGERMFISRGTVRTHLSHIFAKLGLKNRSELAREVTRRTAPED